MRCSAEDGVATAEFGVGTVAAVGMALLLRFLVLTPWFEKNLARPFGLALAALF